MFSAISLRPGAVRKACFAGLGLILAGLVPSQAGAQDLVHHFINPSFGGNPFYSDHLRAIAEIDRPAKPQDPTPEPDETATLIAQLQASFNADVQSQILSAIRTAQPGQTGNFTLGKTQISFTKSAKETRVTFVNSATGETKVIVIPVQGANSSLVSNSTLGLSAEQLLGGSGTALTGLSADAGPADAANNGAPGSLLGAPPLQ